MALISTDVTMNITMISKEAIGRKPSWISIDGTSLTLPNGKSIYFDFENSYGDSEVLDDGRVQVNMTKYGFDKGHYLSDDNQTLEDLDWEQIAKATFTDVFVIGDSKQENFEDLSSSDFTITELIYTVEPASDDDSDNKTTEIILTQKQLDDLNQSIAESATAAA